MRFTYRAAGPITRPILGLGPPGPAPGAVVNRSRRFIAAAAVLTLLCSCSRTQQDWRVAQEADTPRSYEVFVERHPDSELAGVARQRIAQLAEEAVWQQAIRADTAAGYREYLAKYPNGAWSQEARIRMQGRSLAQQSAQETGAAVPQRASGSARPAAAAQKVEPASAERTPAPESAAHAGAGSSAVQLGAFSSAANARNAWTRLSSRFGAELRGLTPQVVPVGVSGRRLYRLEARVTDRAAARRLCRQLAQHAQGCLPVP